MEASIVCVVGGPGVGKGTQCVRLAADLDLVHVSVGELLRVKAAESPDNEKVDIRSVMGKGTLVPSDYVQKVIDGCLKEHVRARRTRFLLDGFPRSKEQAQLFLQSARMAAKTSGRIDDSTQIFRKRYADHIKQMPDMLDMFQGITHDVDCERDLDVIYAELRERVKSLFDPPITVEGSEGGASSAAKHAD